MSRNTLSHWCLYLHHDNHQHYRCRSEYNILIIRRQRSNAIAAELLVYLSTARVEAFHRIFRIWERVHYSKCFGFCSSLPYREVRIHHRFDFILANHYLHSGEKVNNFIKLVEAMLTNCFIASWTEVAAILANFRIIGWEHSVVFYGRCARSSQESNTTITKIIRFENAVEIAIDGPGNNELSVRAISIDWLFFVYYWCLQIYR